MNVIQSVLFRLTGIQAIEPTKQIINDLLQKFSFDELQTLSAEELFAQKLENNELSAALELAQNFGFDSDIVYQRMWRNTAITKGTINEFLSKISDRMWILRECVECVAQDFDDMKCLLEFGLNLTNYDNFVTHFYSLAVAEDKKDGEDIESIDEKEDKSEVTIDWKDMSLESKQVCIWRKRLLQYLDRLNVYEMILSYRNQNNEYNHQFYQTFREMSSFEAIINLGHNSDYYAISILLTYEPKDILEHRLVILSNIDETVSPKKYSSLLPKVVFPKIKGMSEVYEWNQIMLREEDWVEHKFGADCSLNSTQFETDFYAENVIYLKYKTNNLTKQLLTEWYRQRSRQILELTNIVSNSLDLLEIGIKYMVPGLEDLRLNLDVYALLVYESNCKEDIDFEEFEKFSNDKKLEALMSSALDSEQQFLLYIRKFLKVFISKVCGEDHKLLETVGKEMFKQYLVSISKNNLQMCLKVFENSSLSQSENEIPDENALIEDPSDLIEFAIDCIYSSEDPTQLDTAFKIMECLPQREMIAIIADNDSNKIKRLNELNDLADELENYLVVAEIIEQYVCPPTVSQIRDLKKSNDKEEVKYLFTKVMRSCSKRDKPLTVNEWIEVFDNMSEVRKICFSDSISEDQLYETFVETLLCSARRENFGLAVSYMRLDSMTKFKKKVIPFERSKKLIINAAQDYINSADSVNDPNIVLAKECLNLIDPIEQKKDRIITEELNLIEGLFLIEDNFKLKLLPIQLRLIPQPKLELIDKILKSSSKAYTKTSKILELSQLFSVCSDFDEDYRNGTILSMIANVAFDCKDFKHCYDVCHQIIKNNYTIGWKICLKLGLNENYKSVENRLKLLCFALTYCHINYDIEEEEDQQIDILDIINAIKQLKEIHDIKLAPILD